MYVLTVLSRQIILYMTTNSIIHNDGQLYIYINIFTALRFDDAVLLVEEARLSMMVAIRRYL